MLRIKKKIHKPCLRCGKLFEKETKRQTVCKKCRKLAWKHGGETRQKQYKMLEGKFKYFGVRKVSSFSLPKLGPLSPVT